MPLLRLAQTFLRIAIVTSLFCASGVLAQDRIPTDQNRVQAAEAFKKGQVLFENGEYLEAAATFERAYRLAPHPSVLANIGFCYDEVGDYPRAVSAFREYMKRPNPQTPKDTAKISRYLERMKSKVGDLVVNCSAANCEVVVDGVPRGLAPTSIVLLAGPHAVNVAAVGNGPSKHYNVEVPSGGELVLDVDMASAASGPSTAESVEVEEAPSRLRAPFWIASSAAFAGGAAITVLGVLNNRNWQRFEDGGSIDSRLKERGDNFNLGIGISIGVTAAAATTAIVLAIIDLNRKPKKPGEPRRSSRHLERWRITPSGSGFVVAF